MPRENLRWRISKVDPTDTSEHHLLQDGEREAPPERLKKIFKSRKQGEMLSSKIREVGFQRWQWLSSNATCVK